MFVSNVFSPQLWRYILCNVDPRNQVRHTIRLKHYSMSTEEAYVSWIRRFILFHDKRHPREMGIAEIEAFLTHLAVDQQVSASTQNQALHALLFLYQQALHKNLDGPISPMRARRSKYLPTVLTREEALSVIAHLSGTHQLIARILSWPKSPSLWRHGPPQDTTVPQL